MAGCNCEEGVAWDAPGASVEEHGDSWCACMKEGAGKGEGEPSRGGVDERWYPRTSIDEGGEADVLTWARVSGLGPEWWDMVVTAPPSWGWPWFPSTSISFPDEDSPEVPGVPPKKVKICGPDITDSLLEIMNKIAKDVMRQSTLFGLSMVALKYQKAIAPPERDKDGKIVGPIGDLDLKRQTPQPPSKNCPKYCPEKTSPGEESFGCYTLLGQCVEGSALGNLLFGFIAGLLGKKLGQMTGAVINEAVLSDVGNKFGQLSSLGVAMFISHYSDESGEDKPEDKKAILGGWNAGAGVGQVFPKITKEGLNRALGKLLG